MNALILLVAVAVADPYMAYNRDTGNITVRNIPSTADALAFYMPSRYMDPRTRVSHIEGAYIRSKAARPKLTSPLHFLIWVNRPLGFDDTLDFGNIALPGGDVHPDTYLLTMPGKESYRDRWTTVSVPEPTSLILAGLAGILMLRRKKRARI